MSFILDALKKSEAERQRQAGPALLEMRVVRPRRRWPLWGVALAVLLAINGGVLVWLALRKSGEASQAQVVATALGPAAPASGSGTASAAVGAPAVVAPVAGAPAEAALAGTDAPDDSAAAGAEDLPPDYQSISANLPALSLDLHVYSATAGERYALINMRKVREGETTSEGVRVQEITPDGVLLDFRGIEFVLGK